MAQDSNNVEIELLLARMKAIQHESSLIMQVVRLQRMRVEQLERQLAAEKKFRQSHLHGQGLAGCRNCGMPTTNGSVFCHRQCWAEYQQQQKMSNAVNLRRGTRREDTVQRRGV